jgi:hypothetical protein
MFAMSGNDTNNMSSEAATLTKDPHSARIPVDGKKQETVMGLLLQLHDISAAFSSGLRCLCNGMKPCHVGNHEMLKCFGRLRQMIIGFAVDDRIRLFLL